MISFLLPHLNFILSEKTTHKRRKSLKIELFFSHFPPHTKAVKIIRNKRKLNKNLPILSLSRDHQDYGGGCGCRTLSCCKTMRHTTYTEIIKRQLH